jgi:UDP:flavonoid glycosyltransferase YjiC (YdhE family)
VRILALARAAGGGDLHPVVALALGLSQRGHDVVTLADTAASRLPSELQPVVAEELFAAAVARGRAEAESLGPGTRQDEMYARFFEIVNADIAGGLRDHIARLKPDYVLAPRLLAPGAAAAVGDELPWCVVNSTFTFAADDLYAVNRVLAAGFARARLVLHATDEVFDGNSGLSQREHYVGPLFWEPSDDLPGYVEEPGPPWVLVAISSAPQGDVELVPPALAALATHDVRVLATIGPNDQSACGVLPPNVRVERSVSHLRLLERAVLLVSHAGHGSVMKGLWSGVPMVLVPWGRDQPGVAARAGRLGVARIVEPSQLETIGSAIDEVLDDAAYRLAAREHGRRLRATDPITRACDLVEQSV